MAVKFYLPNGTVTHLRSIPVFFTRTPDETLEFLKAVKPDPATGRPNEKNTMQFLAHGVRTQYR